MRVNIADHPPSRAGALPLVADDLALNFANTESGRGRPSHRDHLRACGDVVAWLAHSGVLDAGGSAALAQAAARRKGLGAALLDEALALRAAIQTIGVALARRAPVPDRALGRLGRLNARCLACARLDLTCGRGVWRWRLEATPVEAALGPLALAAAALLTERDLSRVKLCGGADCGWLFYDASRSQRRRWCEMAVCGNRAKQRRRAERLKRR